MGTAAARAALARCRRRPGEVDAIILATSTPDQAFPATALRVQAALGVTRGFGFDIAAACAGFIYALSVADSMIRTGQARGALVIGSEVYSRILNWQDRGTCVLFGDGAGAVFLRAGEGSGQRSTAASSPPTCMPRARSATSCMSMARWVGTTGRAICVMNGREVFRHAVVRLAEAVDEALAANGLTQRDIDWLVPHQANLRIIDAMGRKLGLPPERVVITVDRHANTSAASVPLALAEARRRRAHPHAATWCCWRRSAAD